MSEHHDSKSHDTGSPELLQSRETRRPALAQGSESRSRCWHIEFVNDPKKLVADALEMVV
jgi:hypothetical protein